jgi:uncharacterized protein (TIGR00290 family)
MSWSSGKDSAFALDATRRDPELDVTGLLVTMNTDADRVAMHAVRRELVEAQADRLGLPLHVVEVPAACPNPVYEDRMAAAMATAREQGVRRIAFGDLFLADVRAYREQKLAGTGIAPLFPLWGRPTAALAREMLAVGVRAVVTCVDPRQVPADLAGRDFDASLLAALPAGADPCGERGEFHTFVTDGPGFSAPIDTVTGDRVERDGFVFCDVRPGVREAGTCTASGDPASTAPSSGPRPAHRARPASSPTGAST